MKFNITKAKQIENHYSFYEEDIWSDPNDPGFKLNIRPGQAGFIIIAAMNLICWTGLLVALYVRHMT